MRWSSKGEEQVNDDAVRRINEMLEKPRPPRTQADRIRELRPKIEAARARGYTWPEICEALGVTRSAVFAALGRDPVHIDATPLKTIPTDPGPMKRKVPRWKSKAPES